MYFSKKGKFILFHYRFSMVHHPRWGKIVAVFSTTSITKVISKVVFVFVP